VATVTESRSVIQQNTTPGVRVITWALTTANADGNPVDLTAYPDRTLHIYGTFGGGTLTMQGSNDPNGQATPNSGVDWQSIRDPQGAAIAKTSNYMGALLESPRWLRPNLTGSTAATVTVVVMARGRQTL
jgi:hypothetical protein